MVGLSGKGETAVLAPLTTTAYVSLHTGDPGDTGLNEIVGLGYARLGPATFSNTGSNPTVSANTTILTFAAATGAWGTVSHFGIWDAGGVGAGNFRGSGALATPKAVNSGDTARFVVGALTITAQ